jgi:hypothetical protein
MKNIWNYVSLFLLVGFFTAGLANDAFGQKPGGENREKVREKLKAHKVAFITDKVQLTEAEAEKFWPMYHAYEQEKKSNREDVFEKGNLKKEMTEQEAEATLKNMMEFKSKDLDLEKKYISKFRTVLPASKVVRLIRAEKEFKANMVEKIKDRPGRRGR